MEIDMKEVIEGILRALVTTYWTFVIIVSIALVIYVFDWQDSQKRLLCQQQPSLLVCKDL